MTQRLFEAVLADQEPAESAEARHCERHEHRIGAHELLR
jgi:hypothetical protein